jgi:ABC-2 type transport system permease protein
LLRSVPAFAIRRTLYAFIGWAVGLSAYFLLIGLLAVSLTKFLSANPRFAELAGQAGFSDLATVQGYAAALFSLLGIPLGLFAASRLNLDAADEADGRLTLLFSRSLVRSNWAIAQLGVVATACVLLAGAAGLAVWVGTNAVGAQLRLVEALAGTLNVVPVGLLCLGAAQFAVGWVPRAVLPIGATPAVGGFVLLVLADTFGWPHWIHDLSPFSHVASVPATSTDWPGTAGILAVAVLLTVVGIAGFARRDLRG